MEQKLKLGHPSAKQIRHKYCTASQYPYQTLNKRTIRVSEDDHDSYDKDYDHYVKEKKSHPKDGTTAIPISRCNVMNVRLC